MKKHEKVLEGLDEAIQMMKDKGMEYNEYMKVRNLIFDWSEMVIECGDVDYKKKLNAFDAKKRRSNNNEKKVFVCIECGTEDWFSNETKDNFGFVKECCQWNEFVEITQN